MEQVVFFCPVSRVDDWTIRVDHPHGNKKHDREHVHVRKRGLRGEYSWNIDGTRHDQHRFPKSEKCISAARQHAAEALGIPVSSLSFLVEEVGGIRISILSGADPKSSQLPLFNAYVPIRLSLFLFGSPQGLVLVLSDDA